MKAYDTLHIYCTPGVRAKLVKLANADRRSLSSEVQKLIEQAYDAFQKERQLTKDDLTG